MWLLLDLYRLQAVQPAASYSRLAVQSTASQGLAGGPAGRLGGLRKGSHMSLQLLLHRRLIWPPPLWVMPLVLHL
jgi:hypothetical protein